MKAEIGPDDDDVIWVMRTQVSLPTSGALILVIQVSTDTSLVKSIAIMKQTIFLLFSSISWLLVMNTGLFVQISCKIGQMRGFFFSGGMLRHCVPESILRNKITQKEQKYRQ